MGNCSKVLAGASSSIALVSVATVLVAQTHVASWKASFVAFGQTSRRTLVAMMVGLSSHARVAVVWSMHPTQQGVPQAVLSATQNFAAKTFQIKTNHHQSKLKCSLKLWP